MKEQTTGPKPRVAYTRKEDEFLSDNYTTLGARACAEALGRTYWSVKKRAGQLCLPADRRSIMADIIWSDAEIKALRENYTVYGLKGAMAALPSRSGRAIKNKTQALGIRYEGPRGGARGVVCDRDINGQFVPNVVDQQELDEFLAPCVQRVVQEWHFVMPNAPRSVFDICSLEVA